MGLRNKRKTFRNGKDVWEFLCGCRGWGEGWSFPEKMDTSRHFQNPAYLKSCNF